MTQMSANDEQNGDDAKMMKRRTQGKQEDYAQPHADWLLAAPTIQSSATSGYGGKESKHSIFDYT